MYGAKEVSLLTSKSKSSAYELINKLQKEFLKEDNTRIIINGKIPINYFNKVVLGIDSSESQIKEQKSS